MARGRDPWPRPVAATRGRDPWPRPVAATRGRDSWPRLVAATRSPQLFTNEPIRPMVHWLNRQFGYFKQKNSMVLKTSLFGQWFFSSLFGQYCEPIRPILRAYSADSAEPIRPPLRAYSASPENAKCNRKLTYCACVACGHLLWLLKETRAITPKVQDFQKVYHSIEVMVCSNNHDMAECVRPTSPDGRERIPESVVNLVRFCHVQQ